MNGKRARERESERDWTKTDRGQECGNMKAKQTESVFDTKSVKVQKCKDEMNR